MKAAFALDDGTIVKLKLHGSRHGLCSGFPEEMRKRLGNDGDQEGHWLIGKLVDCKRVIVASIGRLADRHGDLGSRGLRTERDRNEDVALCVRPDVWSNASSRSDYDLRPRKVLRSFDEASAQAQEDSTGGRPPMLRKNTKPGVVVFANSKKPYCHGRVLFVGFVDPSKVTANKPKVMVQLGDGSRMTLDPDAVKMSQ
jgi:hypothetical protein